MDDLRFDALAKRVGTSRRSLLKRMVGLGGAAVVAGLSVSPAEAARRGYAGPPSAPTVSSRSTTYCTLTDPSCCLSCELFPWADERALLQQWTSCNAGPYSQDQCEHCRKVIEGTGSGFCYW